MKLRLPLACCLLLMGLPGVRAQSVPPAEPKLVIIIPASGLNYFTGELVREDADTVTIIDLRSGEQRSVERKTIKEIKRSATDEEIIAETDLPTVMAWKVNKLSGGKALVGKIAKVSDAVVYLNLGSKNGVMERQVFTVFRDQGEIIDPTTKQVIGRDRPRVAQLQVTEVQEGYCKAKLMGEMETKLQVGDDCELPPLKVSVAVLPLVGQDNKAAPAGTAMAEQLTTALVERKVQVVERSLLTKALGELALQNTALFDEATARKVGMQAGASTVMTGKIVNDGVKTLVFVRLIDVQSGRVLLAGSERAKVPVAAAAAATGTGTGGATAGASPTALAAGKPPPEDRLVGEDEHKCTIGGWSGPRGNEYKITIPPDKPKVRVSASIISVKMGTQGEVPAQGGRISVSVDYGKTWVDIYDLDKPTLMRGKRSNDWYHIPLAGAGLGDVAKRTLAKADGDIDEIQVRFGMGYGLTWDIQTVIWSK